MTISPLTNFLKSYSRALLFGLAVAVGVFVTLTAVYSLCTESRVNVGEWGDAPYVSGFTGDEAGAIRYRWTGGTGISGDTATGRVTLPLRPVGNASHRLRVEIGAPFNKDAKVSKPPLVDIIVNGVPITQAQTVEGQVAAFEFALPDNIIEQVTVEIKSPWFEAGGRKLGVKVQTVQLMTDRTLRLPPLEVWLWSALYVGAIGLIMFKIRPNRTLLAFLVGIVAFVPLVLLPFVAPRNINIWYTPNLISFAAIAAATLALIVWHKTVSEWLWEFPARIDAPEGRKLARNILIVASLIYAVYSLTTILQMDFIGHADYADNAVVARNFVRGNGFSVDYAAQFYQRWGSLPHPADTWPLLQPSLITPFYLLFGPTVWAAKLPGLIIMLALVWAIYHYASLYFNRKTALMAALITLTTPALFEAVAYPINDLTFTLLAWLALFTVYRAATYRPMAGAAQTVEPTAESEKPSRFRPIALWFIQPAQRMWLLAGLWGGLLIWSKPSGGIILLGAGLWLLWHKFFNSAHQPIKWRSLFLWGGAALLIASPYFVRGLVLGGTPLYSTERWDVWLLKYFPPDDRIYDLYYPLGRKLPEARLLLDVYGFDTTSKAIYNQFRIMFDQFFSGYFVPPLLWPLALVGIVGMARRRYNWLWLLATVLVIYLVFINVYWHYEVRYLMVWRPWLYLLAAFGLSWLYDKIRVGSQDGQRGRNGKLGGWLLAAAFLILTLPNLPAIAEGSYTSRTGIVITADWIKANTPANSVVMSRNVWELSFHADRKSVMFPNNISQLDQMRQVMQDYKVKYLQFDHARLDEPVWQQRTALFPFLKGEDVPGYKLVYRWNDFLIYEVIAKP